MDGQGDRLTPHTEAASAGEAEYKRKHVQLRVAGVHCHRTTFDESSSKGRYWHMGYPPVDQNRRTPRRGMAVSYTHLDVYKRQGVKCRAHCTSITGTTNHLGRKCVTQATRSNTLTVYKQNACISNGTKLTGHTTMSPQIEFKNELNEKW